MGSWYLKFRMWWYMVRRSEFVCCPQHSAVTLCHASINLFARARTAKWERQRGGERVEFEAHLRSDCRRRRSVLRMLPIRAYIRAPFVTAAPKTSSSIYIVCRARHHVKDHLSRLLSRTASDSLLCFLIIICRLWEVEWVELAPKLIYLGNKSQIRLRRAFCLCSLQKTNQKAWYFSPFFLFSSSLGLLLYTPFSTIGGAQNYWTEES